MRSPSRLPRGVLVATGPVVLVVAGIVGYLSFGYSLWMAVAMTLLTLTTVGFASGTHLSTGALVFSAGLAVLGVGLFVVILGLAATAIVEGRVSLFSRSRRMRRHLDELRGHFIVCAYGRVGRAIAAELEAEGVPFVVVDSKGELEPDLERDQRRYLIGDASDEAVLRKAGIERARGLICAVDSDAENVFITIVARSLSPGLLIVARAARQHSADRLHRAGATHVVSPYVTSGTRMANLALRPHVVEFFDLAGAGQPGLRLEELAITEGSPLAGRSLRDLRGPAVPLLIRHPSGQLVANPARELQLQAGDVLVLFGQASDLDPLDRDEDTGTPLRARHMPGRGSPLLGPDVRAAYNRCPIQRLPLLARPSSAACSAAGRTGQQPWRSSSSPHGQYRKLEALQVKLRVSRVKPATPYLAVAFLRHDRGARIMTGARSWMICPQLPSYGALSIRRKYSAGSRIGPVAGSRRGACCSGGPG